MMKRAVAAVVLAVGMTGGAAWAEGTPKIKFDRTEYDFGTTSMVQSITGTFTFENVGDAELKVSKPTPSCGCTVAGVKPETLKPGEKGELTFTVNIGPVRGMAQKYITVPSNDPSNSAVRLTIKVNVKQVFEYSPMQISLGDLRQGVITNVTIEVKRTDGKDLKLQNVQNTSKLLHARVETAGTATGQVARVVVQAEAEGIPQRFNDAVQIFIADNPSPIASIPVYGRIVGDVTVTPERLIWGISNLQRLPASQSSGLLVRKITVACTKEGAALQLRTVTSSLKDLNVEVVPVEEGKIYSVVAKLAESPKQSETGTITIETNLPSEPTVVVPVNINVFTR